MINASIPEKHMPMLAIGASAYPAMLVNIGRTAIHIEPMNTAHTLCLDGRQIKALHAILSNWLAGIAPPLVSVSAILAEPPQPIDAPPKP